MWKNRDDNGNVTLSKNIFSKAIKKAMKMKYPQEEDILKYDSWDAAERAGYRKNYNCIGAAISAAMGEEIGYRFVEKLDEDLEYGTVTPLRTSTKRLQGNSGMYNYGR